MHSPSRKAVVPFSAIVLVIMGLSLPGCLPPTPAPGGRIPATQMPNKVSSPIPIPTKLFPIQEGRYWGYIDISGRIVIKPQYDDAREFSEGLAAVRMGQKWGYINAAGQVVIKPEHDNAGRFSQGLALVKRGAPNSTGYEGFCKFSEMVKSEGGLEKWGYIDTTGALVIGHQYDAVNTFSEGLAAVRIGNKWGYINALGSWVVPAEYDEACWFSEGLALVRKGEKSWYINTRGEVVISPQYQAVGKFSEGLAAVRMGQKFGYINKAGQMVIRPEFYQALAFSEGLAAVNIQGRRGYIDATGQVVVPPQYDSYTLVTIWGISEGRFSEGLAAVRSGDKFGYVDKTGKLAINLQFDEAADFSGGLARVSPFGYIDRSGTRVWPPGPKAPTGTKVAGPSVAPSTAVWVGYSVSDAKLADSKINDILVDKNNTKWFATKGGLSRFADGQWLLMTKTDPEIQRLMQELGTNASEVVFASMASDNNGDIWVVTDFISNTGVIPGGMTKFSGDGRNYVDRSICGVRVRAGRRDGVDVYTDAFKIRDVRVVSPRRAREDSPKGDAVWAVGEQHFCYDEPELRNYYSVKVPQQILASTGVDARQDIWVAFYRLDNQSSGLARINVDDQRDNFWLDSYETMPGMGRPLALAMEAYGKVWIGTDEGVKMFDGRTWVGYDPRNSGLRGTEVRDVAIDKDGNKWFATEKGVSAFDGSSWKTYTVADGLVSDNIMALAVDEDNVIWIGTDRGVSRLERSR